MRALPTLERHQKALLLNLSLDLDLFLFGDLDLFLFGARRAPYT